jgi:ComF family protein
MIDQLLSIGAPHYCYGCGKIGAILCRSCINNIIEEPFVLCAACSNPAIRATGLCGNCRPPYSRAWIGGAHVGALDAAIDGYKFGAARGAADTLAELLHQRLPRFTDNIVLVPLPTVARHVRERGFDHTKVLVHQLARRQKVPYNTSLLRRCTPAVQREANAEQRWRQAKEMFTVRGAPAPDAVYVLVDDVMTTGASLWHGARALRQAGAHEVWVATVARQVLA